MIGRNTSPKFPVLVELSVEEQPVRDTREAPAPNPDGNEGGAHSTPFRAVMRPADVEKLTGVLNEHCTKHGIRSEEARQSVALALLDQYNRGVTDDRKLAQILEEQDRPR